MKLDFTIVTDRPVGAVDISKTFGSGRYAKPAVNKASITLSAGSIYGLVGNNGAGKSTLMKILCGITEPDSGTVSLPRGKIGSLIEAPALHGDRSVRDNLVLAALLLGNVKEQEIDQTLETVGLAKVAGRKAGKLSLGMKQRLGLGIAMLGNPAVLVLDEPMNGLDPEGIVTFRNILLKLKQEGKAILISSHLIDELVKVADVYGIMVDGEIVEEVTAEQLQHKTGRRIYIGTPNPTDARAFLQKHNITSKIESAVYGRCVPAGHTLLSIETNTEPDVLNAELVNAHIGISGLWTESVNMERYFVEQMSGKSAAGKP